MLVIVSEDGTSHDLPLARCSCAIGATLHSSLRKAETRLDQPVPPSGIKVEMSLLDTWRIISARIHGLNNAAKLDAMLRPNAQGATGSTSVSRRTAIVSSCLCC